MLAGLAIQDERFAYYISGGYEVICASRGPGT